jgi:hypothetical protein
MTLGLIVFIATVVADVLALLVDLALEAFGLPTITATVRKHLWLVIPMAALQVVGTIGLVYHIVG